MLYHTTNPQEIEDVQIAVGAAAELALANGTHEAAIAVYGETNLDGLVSDAIGEKAVADLQDPGGTWKFAGVKFHLITRKSDSGFRNGVLIVVHAADEYLDRLISDQRATDVIYVPWGFDELEEYLAARQSTSL